MSAYKEIYNRLDEIYKRINPEDDSWIEDVDKIIRLFSEFEKLKDFITAIEAVKTEFERRGTRNDDRIKRINAILFKLKKIYPDFLIERLRNKGYRLAKNASLRKAINDQMLRMLEQLRLGKRDSVCGMLLRIFVVNGEEFPEEIIEAIKPKYDENLFRAYMYAFLSGFIKQDREEGNE